MAYQPAFSRYLIGSVALERPAFFYAYSGLWLHLVLGSLALALCGRISLLDGLAATVISSLSMGLIIYSLIARQYGLLLNLGPYAIGLVQAFQPGSLGAVFPLVAVIISLASGFYLLGREYRRYTVEVGQRHESGPPAWITGIMAAVLLLLFLCGLSLLN